MATIHIIDQVDNLRRLKDSRIAHEWESGCCAVDREVAAKLIGADLFIHEGMSKPSRFGGTITGFRVHDDAESARAVIFRFKATNDHRDVKTSRTGWTNDTKIIW